MVSSCATLRRAWPSPDARSTFPHVAEPLFPYRHHPALDHGAGRVVPGAARLVDDRRDRRPPETGRRVPGLPAAQVGRLPGLGADPPATRLARPAPCAAAADR